MQLGRWVGLADGSDTVSPAGTRRSPYWDIMHRDKEATEEEEEEEGMRRILGLLDAPLEARTLLVGGHVTPADITVVSSLLGLYSQFLELSFCQAFPNTNCWFLTHMNQPQFQAALGELKLCEKMARLDPKRFAESQPKKDTPWKEKGSQEARQRPQTKQKEEKKVAALLPRRSWVN